MHCHDKRGYETKKAARGAAAGRPDRLRVYLCPFCMRYHLTSQRLYQRTRR